jgi:hypothetical protein
MSAELSIECSNFVGQNNSRAVVSAVWDQPSDCNVSVDGCVFRGNDAQKTFAAAQDGYVGRFVVTNCRFDSRFDRSDFPFLAAATGNVVGDAATHTIVHSSVLSCQVLYGCSTGYFGESAEVIETMEFNRSRAALLQSDFARGTDGFTLSACEAAGDAGGTAAIPSSGEFLESPPPRGSSVIGVSSGHNCTIGKPHSECLPETFKQNNSTLHAVSAVPKDPAPLRGVRSIRGDRYDRHLAGIAVGAAVLIFAVAGTIIAVRRRGSASYTYGSELEPEAPTEFVTLGTMADTLTALSRL